MMLTDSSSQKDDAEMSTSSSSTILSLTTDLSSQIAELIYDRAETIRSLPSIQDQNPTQAITSLLEYVYQWVWVHSHPSLRTPEILTACHEAAPNTIICPAAIDNTNSLPETKTSSNQVQTTFLGRVLHQELSEIKRKQEDKTELTDDDIERIGSLFETMIKLDISTFMRIVLDHHIGFLHQTLNIIFQLLENDEVFRQSPKGLKALHLWLEHPKSKDEKINLSEFIQVTSWGLNPVKSNEKNKDTLKQSIFPFIAKFFKEYNGTLVSPDDDPIKLIKAYKVILQADIAKSSFTQYARGMSTQAKKVDLAYTKPSPLDASLKRLGLFSDILSTNKNTIVALQSDRVKLQALDLAEPKRKHVSQVY